MRGVVIRSLVVRTLVCCALGGAELVAASWVSSLLAEHRCWTGAAPVGSAAPTRAVVTLPGRAPALVAAEVGYGVWLDGDPGVVHGFCP